MKPNHTPLVALTCASLLGTAALSKGGILWSDDFNGYANGGFAHQGLGTGWPGNWFQVGGGGTIEISGGGVTGNGDIRRDLGVTFSTAVGASGTIWVSFDWGHNSSHSGTYGGLTFFDGDNSTERVLIGNTYDPANWNMNGAPADSGVSSIGMKTGVARITLNPGAGNDVIDLWVGATGSPVDVSGPPLATTSDRNLEGVRVIRIMGGNDQTFDNLVFGTEVADVDAIDGAPPTPTSGTWTNTAGGTWSTAGNWLGDTVATGSESTADFNTLNLAEDTTVTVDSARTIGNLVFGDTDTSSAAGWTLTGSALTLAGTTPTVTVNALGDTKAATISSGVAGSAGLTKAGSGTLTLSGANTYSGTTTVSAGTLQVSGQSYFNVGRTTSVASGAVFELNDSNNTFTSLMPVSSITGAGTFRLSGNSTINQELNGSVSDRLTFAMDAGGLIDLQGTSRLTNGGWKQMNWTGNNASLNVASGATFDIWDGLEVRIDALTGSGTVVKGHPDPNTFLLTLGVANGSGTFSGTIQNTSGAGTLALTKTGNGIQTLSGTNTYNGNTTVNDGTLNIAPDGSLRFRPTGNGQTNSLTGSETATLSYLGTVDLDLSAVDTTDGNFWTLVNVGSFGTATLEPDAVTSAIGDFSDVDDDGIWELSTPSATWTFDEFDGSLGYTVTATDYELWGEPYGLAAGSEEGDLDNDGVSNFEEYAFGLLPDSGASVNPISVPLDKASGTFSYTRRSDSGLTYSVWFSEDLSVWTEDTGATEGAPAPSGDNETVEVTLSVDPLPTKLFIQVRAD